jgi:hypothetical protein
MTSFTPGNKSYAKRMINYNAVYNKLNANSLNYNLQPNSQCACISEIFNKNIASSGTDVLSKVPYNIRISQVINYSLGGKTQYGNFYLGQPLNVNCFGRVQGMPGGYGSPPVNKFN